MLKKLVRRGPANVPTLLAIFFILGLWQLVSISTPSFLLPGPYATLKEMLRTIISQEFLIHSVYTIRRVLISFLVAFFFANLIAILSSVFSKAEKFWRPIVVIGLAIPAVIATFIGVVVFGSRGPVSVVVVSALLIPELFLIVYPVYKNLKLELSELAKVFAISRVRYYKQIVVPQLLPFLFSMIRFGINVGWKITILTEVFSHNNGVGYKIYYYFGLFSIKGVLAWFLAFGLIMAAIDYLIIGKIERRLLTYEKH